MKAGYIIKLSMSMGPVGPKTVLLYYHDNKSLTVFSRYSRNANEFDPDFFTCDIAVHYFKYDDFFLIKKVSTLKKK